MTSGLIRINKAPEDKSHTQWNIHQHMGSLEQRDIL